MPEGLHLQNVFVSSNLVGPISWMNFGWRMPAGVHGSARPKR